jgi:hypothetical protein
MASAQVRNRSSHRYCSDLIPDRVLLHQALRREMIEEHRGLFMNEAKSLVLALLGTATPENLGEVLKQ